MLLVEIPWASRVWALRYPQREIVATADRAYASLKLLERCRKLSDPITFITRLRLDAALYEPAPLRRPGQIGRARIKGERLPNLSVVAEDPTTVWKPTEIASWYGSGERTVEIASKTAVRYSTGLFAVPLRWVLIRDPKEGFKPQTLLCTDLDADPEEILRWFVMRWQLEVSFQKMRRHLWNSNRRGSGRIWRYGAPHRLCWGCSRWSLCSPISGWRSQRVLSGRRPGTARDIRPSLMRSRWCAKSNETRSRLFTGRHQRPTR